MTINEASERTVFDDHMLEDIHRDFEEDLLEAQAAAGADGRKIGFGLWTRALARGVRMERERARKTCSPRKGKAQ